MSVIYTCRFDDCLTPLSGEAIRSEITRFAAILANVGVPSARVWCSWNSDLPDDSPLQSPDAVAETGAITAFFDQAVRNNVWSYGDGFNRAGIDAVDDSFQFFLGNDRDIRLTTENGAILDAVRAAWISAHYEIYEGSGSDWLRTHPRP